MTQERVDTAQSLFVEAEPKRITFQLKIVKPWEVVFDIGDKEKRTHPILHVFLKPNTPHLFANLRFQLTNFSRETKTAELEFEELESCDNESIFEICKMRANGKEIRFGNDEGIIVFHDIEKAGVWVLIALRKDIKVISEERKQQLVA